MTRPEPATVERVAVLGAGTIGASWTAQFLARGLSVAVHDPAPDCATRVREFVAAAWPTLERLGLSGNADPNRVSFHGDPAAAVEGASLVQENGPENLEVKRALFAGIDAALASEAVVASSTSGFMPSELQAGRRGPERYVVGHPFNPPHLIPLVEVVGGRATDPAVVDWTADFYAALGKRPIRIRREVPGHVANLMQGALDREAIHLVLEGSPASGASTPRSPTGLACGGRSWARTWRTIWRVAGAARATCSSTSGRASSAGGTIWADPI